MNNITQNKLWCKKIYTIFLWLDSFDYKRSHSESVTDRFITLIT